MSAPACCCTRRRERIIPCKTSNESGSRRNFFPMPRVSRDTLRSDPILKRQRTGEACSSTNLPAACRGAMAADGQHAHCPSLRRPRPLRRTHRRARECCTTRDRRCLTTKRSFSPSAPGAAQVQFRPPSVDSHHQVQSRWLEKGDPDFVETGPSVEQRPALGGCPVNSRLAWKGSAPVFPGTRQYRAGQTHGAEKLCELAHL